MSIECHTKLHCGVLFLYSTSHTRLIINIQSEMIYKRFPSIDRVLTSQSCFGPDPHLRKNLQIMNLNCEVVGDDNDT